MESGWVNLESPPLPLPLPQQKGAASNTAIDVVFPVMHGPLCEDGTIQGLLELADVPYVGSGVLASAVGMDKDVAKRLVRDAGLPIVPYLTIKDVSWKKDFDALSEKAFKTIGLPLFVKPANLGSSVGVHKVKQREELRSALEDAFRYDTKILIEKAINAREIEFAVLENSDPSAIPLVSQPGEIVPRHEFYSYEAKYLDDKGAELLIPAKLDSSQIARGQQIAREVFTILECEGMARVDFFVDRNTGDFYFNEVNTLPGFTSISMYPKMWEASGIPYDELLNRLIDLAMARHRRKRKLTRNYEKSSGP
jgi:D-alanine-D-alanine ligase